MKSPFKFLDSYTREDESVFFGRDEEIKNLYQLVYKSPLMLVYGASGTGKTSLVQCGLGSRFDLTDWYPFEIRRNNNINDSLREHLAEPAGGKLRKNSMTETIAWIYKNYLRPVYLIFDQLEELFILGDETEQSEFIQHINDIINAELPCKIILVMREEYIAQLYQFEQVIPTLFDRRLRVEPMNTANVAQVITGSCEQYGIEIEDPEESVPIIIDNVSGGKAGIQLPYLQVYLDRLWGETKDGSSIVRFTKEGIHELGEIDDVLEKFLQQQREDIQRFLEKDLENVPADALRRLLDVFVTEEGTKQPVAYTRDEGEIILEKRIQDKLSGLSDEVVVAGLEALDQGRILRFTDKQIELAHDSLADLIDKERSSEQRQLNQIKKRISAAYVEYKEEKVFLTERQLNSLEEYIPLLNLERNLLDFLEACRTDIAHKKQAEQERQERELKLTQDKLAAEQRASKRQRIFTGVISVALILAIIAVVWGRSQQLQAVREKEISDSIRLEAVENLENFLKAKTEKEQAEAQKVEQEISDILTRADALSAKYPAVSRGMLVYADSVLGVYGENQYLDSLRANVVERLER